MVYLPHALARGKGFPLAPPALINRPAPPIEPRTAASWLARRFGLCTETAALIADLAGFKAGAVL
jgi:hypothetical protein